MAQNTAQDKAQEPARETARDQDPDEIRRRLTAFFTERLADAGLAADDLTPQSPLKEWGVLDSLGMARLVGFIRSGLGVAVPARALTGRNFRTIEDIAGLVAREQAAGS